MSLREDIFAHADGQKIPVEIVATPELPKYDGMIGVTRISARAVADLFQYQPDEEEDLDAKARFVQRVACDVDGNSIFQEEDVLKLSVSRYLTPVIERIYWAGREFNGLTDENRRNWRKNSEATAGGGSPSSSAGPSTPATA